MALVVNTQSPAGKQVDQVESQEDRVMVERAASVGKIGALKGGVLGLDIGTSFLVASWMQGEAGKSNVVFRSQRSAFLELEATSRNLRMLEQLKHAFIQVDKKLYLLGDPAIDLANAFTSEVRRPMRRGVLAPKEKDAIRIMRLMVKHLLEGIPEGTLVMYSSPADPVDHSLDTTYHRDLMCQIIEDDLKCKAISMNEAYGLAHYELAEDKMTGLCFSFGGGMVNAVMTFAGMDVLQFSLPKGGDWIDEGAANARGTTASIMQMMKEEGVNLSKPKNEDHQAIAIFYKRLIREALESFVKMLIDEFFERDFWSQVRIA